MEGGVGGGSLVIQCCMNIDAASVPRISRTEPGTEASIQVRRSHSSTRVLSDHLHVELLGEERAGECGVKGLPPGQGVGDRGEQVFP